MEAVDISQLPEDVQQVIKVQMLIQRMQAYGRISVDVEGRGQTITNGFNNLENPLEIVDFKELEQGCETWVKDEKYPIRGCFVEDKRTTVAQFKKILPTLFYTLTGKGIVSRIISALYLQKNWQAYLYFTYRGMRNVYAEAKFYSQPVREVYRLVSDVRIREIVCACLEYDTAYRFRFQDACGEVNKEQFTKNPVAEIERVINIVFSRETRDGGLKKFSGKMRWLYLYLRWNKKLLGAIKEMVLQADLDELRLSKEDIYWTNRSYPDYNFRGLTQAERLQEYQKEKSWK